jgi:hypothetical protein
MPNIVYQEVAIDISVEDTGESHEGYVKRADKHRIAFYDHVTDASKSRLQRFAETKRQRGMKVHGCREGNNMRFYLFIREQKQT